MIYPSARSKNQNQHLEYPKKPSSQQHILINQKLYIKIAAADHAHCHFVAEGFDPLPYKNI